MSRWVPSARELEMFRDVVWNYYVTHRRAMPWREPQRLLQHGDVFDPYAITVSEIMLQQTQVSRVVPKFEAFMASYPTVQALARADLGEVLAAWNGLGYNRRAKFLHQTARIVVEAHAGQFPSSRPALEALPGIGHHTAGAIMVYAYNQAEVFLETNIRTVFIYHFFADVEDKVHDRKLLPLVEAAMDRENPREWYWALMDYGTFIKRTVGNLSRVSQGYAKQSPFHGSRRQLRGQVIRLLLKGPHSIEGLQREINDARLTDVVQELQDEGLIMSLQGQYKLG